MKRSLALPLACLALLASCGPVTGPSVAPSPARAEPTPIVAPASVAPTAAPTARATDASPPPAATPPAARPTATASAAAPVRNEGQAILAALRGSLFVGEGGTGRAEVLHGPNYALDGAALDGAAVSCVSREAASGGDVCAQVRIVPPRPLLVQGQRYELRYLGTPVGTFVASGLDVATRPRAIGASATQQSLTVRFDRPMKHVSTCGGVGAIPSVAGSIEHIHTSSATFPGWQPTTYTTRDALFGSFLLLLHSPRVAPDCAGVTFESGYGAAAGTYRLDVIGVEDEAGNLMEPASFTVTIVDEGPPGLLPFSVGNGHQTASGTDIQIRFSEAMDRRTVLDPVRYRLDDRPMPAGSTISCQLPACEWIVVRFPAATFAYAQRSVLVMNGLRDSAGNVMRPDPARSNEFEVR